MADSHRSTADDLQVLFMGTGSSAGAPIWGCLGTQRRPNNAYAAHWDDNVSTYLRWLKMERSTGPPPGSSRDPLSGHYDAGAGKPACVPCPSCREAVSRGCPEGWKNVRGSPSVLVRKRNASGKCRDILVDVGSRVDAPNPPVSTYGTWSVHVLTTDSDAIHLREGCITDPSRSIPVYTDEETLNTIGAFTPYLGEGAELRHLRKTERLLQCTTAGAEREQIRSPLCAPMLQWHALGAADDRELAGINVSTIKLHHGGPLDRPDTCLGFLFDKRVLYISDLHELPAPTLARFQTLLDNQPRQLTIVDMLRVLPDGHASHLTMTGTLHTLIALGPSRALTVGMTQPLTHYACERKIKGELVELEPGELTSLDPSALEDGSVIEHPSEQWAQVLLHDFWTHASAQALILDLIKWVAEGGSVEPAWDGLGIRVTADGGEQLPEGEGTVSGWWPSFPTSQCVD
ncbi:hypothetical protein Q5752_003248 [Cryptotrichosporon argae]